MMLDDIEYSFYNYHVSWEEAKIICLGYKSQLATLDMQNKAMYLTRQLADSNPELEEFWIGSKKNLRGHWVWDANDEKLLPNTFFYNSTTTPMYLNHFPDNDFQCLTLFRRLHHIPLLLPRRCSEQKPFICEKDAYSTNNIIKVFTVNVDGKILILYSANLTWSEAVFQCRQQGLQIAEISTLTEARSMAVGMLKVRPRSIESAWIAGYINNRVWKWLSSGVNIPRNELWQSSHVNSGSCLLLDRHVRQRPRYLSLRCDRRRDFICQTPQEQEPASDPLQVTIDDCKYWIIVVPLNWYEANQLCKKLNTTLVSLDSPATVNHIANIMLDNRELLRHIWIGGKKESVRENISEKDLWKWDDTGSMIPGPGESFIPWCKDCRLFEQNSDCLNMDLEDVDGSMVYGLNCNNKQRYICQEESTTCIGMKNKLLPLHPNNLVSTPKKNMSAIRFETLTRIDESKYNNTESISTHQNSSKFLQTTPNINDYDSLRIHNESRRPFDDCTITNERNTKDNITGSNEKTNSEQPLSMENKNFKDIIAYMVKKINDDRSEAMRNTTQNSLLGIPNSKYDDNSHHSNQAQVNDRSNKLEQILSIKEKVSKILQSSIEKKWQKISSTTPSMSILNLENLLTDTSSPYPKNAIKSQFSPIPRNLYNTQVDRPLQKNQKEWSKSLVLGGNDPNIMFNFGQVIRNAFDKNHTNNFDTHEPIPSMDAHKKHEINDSFHNATRIKNEISTLLPISIKKFEKRIQSLKNNRNKNVNDIKVDDLINAFQNKTHDQNLKQELLSIHTDIGLDSKKNYVDPWNVLLNRIIQSYNHTNKKVVGFKVLGLK